MELNELSGIVIGHAIEIHRALGPGLLENPYKECLAQSLARAGFKVEKEKPLPLIYRDVQIDCSYRLDLLVENKLLLEIKAVEALNEIHMAQTLTYLKLGNFPLGLLINFNSVYLKDGIKRVIHSVDKPK